MTIYLPPPGRLIQGWRLSRQNLNFVDVKIWLPPTFGSRISGTFLYPPPFRVSAFALPRLDTHMAQPSSAAGKASAVFGLPLSGSVDHGLEVITPVEAVFELGQVARGVLPRRAASFQPQTRSTSPIPTAVKKPPRSRMLIHCPSSHWQDP